MGASVAGIDLFRGQWLAAVLPLEGTAKLEFRLDGSLERLAAGLPAARAIGVDIPIGLAPGGPRAADALAAAFIGGRRSSVFAMPGRDVLMSDTHGAAVRISRERGLAAPSIQAFGLRRHIVEAELVAAADSRVIEVHPEVCFRAMAGRPLKHSKKTWNGMRERLRLLAEHGIGIQADIGEAGRAGVDDVLDAAAVAWTARRYLGGEARSLPDPPEDFDGRQVAIWY